jgi:hypothetical protein
VALGSAARVVLGVVAEGAVPVTHSGVLSVVRRGSWGLRGSQGHGPRGGSLGAGCVAAEVLLLELGSCRSLLVALRSAQGGELAAAKVEERHSLPSGVVVAVAVDAAEADGVGEEAVASNGRAAAGEFARLARSVLAAEEEALALDAQDLERRMRSHGPAPSVAILLVVEGLAAELAAPARRAAVVVLTVPAALSRRRRAELPGSRTRWISTPMSVSYIFNANALASALSGAWHTYIPVLPPLRQIRVVNPAVTANMLARSHDHVLRRVDVHDGRFSGVGVRHPYCYREAVCCAAKRHRQGAFEKEKERRGSILICWFREYMCATLGCAIACVGSDAL